METRRNGKWSARCDCYNNHESSSGRCQSRNVTDPTARPETNDGVYCEECRAKCGISDYRNARETRETDCTAQFWRDRSDYLNS